jgi:hypothetical protein
MNKLYPYSYLKKIVEVYPSNASKGFPIRLKVDWDNDTKEYVLREWGFFFSRAFGLEELESMKRILVEANSQKDIPKNKSKGSK